MNTLIEQSSILSDLLIMQDLDYKQFQQKLMPTVDPERVLGIRIPHLRRYAKRIAKEERAQVFLKSLPHRYYDEDNLHGALLEEIKDFDTALAAVEAFLPYLDNWATCDLFCPKVLKKDPDRFLKSLQKWLQSQHPYTVRYALVRLTAWYLEDALFEESVLSLAAAPKSEEYYVQMAQAWFFSMALAKQYKASLPYLLEQKLPAWVHNKAIQKAVESYQLSPEKKQFLKALKRRNENEDLAL